MNIEQIFKGMRDQPVFGRGTYINETGDFVVEIRKLLAKASEQKRGETFFICEFSIVESDNEKHPAGASRSWTSKFSQQSTFGNIKELMFAAIGKHGTDVPLTDDAHELVSALATAACSEQNGADVPSALATLKKFGINGMEGVSDLLVGTHVRLRTVQTKTRAGGDFTRHVWAPVEE